MRIIGHRGAAGYAPENTLESFELAIRQGVSMIELDIHRCAIGELVVIHDELLDRTTNGKGLVADMTWEELKELNAGGGNRIPLLAEVLDAVHGRVKINIELKGQNVASSLALLLQQYISQHDWQADDFYVSSFDHPQLKQFHGLFPQLRIGILYESYPTNYLVLSKETDAASINLSVHFCSKDLISEIHNNGLEVWVYTVNESDVYEKLNNWGVDAVFTNYPDRFL